MESNEINKVVSIISEEKRHVYQQLPQKVGDTQKMGSFTKYSFGDNGSLLSEKS
jgi:hypothetical protein